MWIGASRFVVVLKFRFLMCSVVLQVRRRLPEFSPARVLDFGAGTGSAFW